jgi:choline dehydrogenase-like flavoprotein
VYPHVRVKGIRKLRVVDASVVPTIVSANTDAAIIMIAEKAADMIKEDSQSKYYKLFLGCKAELRG